MKSINIDVKDVLGTVSLEAINSYNAKAADSLRMLHDGTGAGSDFLGWVNLPSATDNSLLDDIAATAENLRNSCEAVVAIGIGGSYLGAKAVIEALSDSFAAYKKAEGTTDIGKKPNFFISSIKSL